MSNKQFLPGSLSEKSSIDDVRDYWDAETPNAPDEIRQLAARLTYEVLHRAPDAVNGDRSRGETESYAPLRAPGPSGAGGKSARPVVVAAIDARKSYVKFDFLLPPDDAKRYRDERSLRILIPRRRGGTWCGSSVGTGITFSQAVELLQKGLDFEFGQAPKQRER